MGTVSTQNSPPDTFRGLKAPLGEHSCIAYVAAMASRSSLTAFLGWCATRRGAWQATPPFTEHELYAYLMHCGFLAGTAFEFTERMPEMVPDKVMVPMAIMGQAAYLRVASPDPKWHHAVYWDGEQVWDPRADMRDGKPLSEYQILLWVPINSIGQC